MEPLALSQGEPLLGPGSGQLVEQFLTLQRSGWWLCLRVSQFWLTLEMKLWLPHQEERWRLRKLSSCGEEGTENGLLETEYVLLENRWN